ncbi:MAG: hypothetical protein H6Q68_510 [Firmicutes bacterium]|nr:hypothetical protein [Bacillota bacterium]
MSKATLTFEWPLTAESESISLAQFKKQAQIALAVKHPSVLRLGTSQVFFILYQLYLLESIY